MTTERHIRLGPGQSRTPDAAARAADAARKRNRDFFQARRWALRDRYPDHWLLIYGEQIVEAFADPLRCIDRRDALDAETRATAMVGTPDQAGIWIL